MIRKRIIKNFNGSVRLAAGLFYFIEGILVFNGIIIIVNLLTKDKADCSIKKRIGGNYEKESFIRANSSIRDIVYSYACNGCYHHSDLH